MDLTFNVADLLGNNFDARRTRVWLETNIPDGVIVDSSGNEIRLGTTTAEVGTDGTGIFEGVMPTNAATNPTAFQYQFHADYPDRNASKGRGQWSSGWFSQTVTADISDLAAEVATPPTYASTLMTQLDDYAASLEPTLDAYVTSAAASEAAAETAETNAETARDEAEAARAGIVGDLGTTDSQAATLAASGSGSLLDDVLVGREGGFVPALGVKNAADYAGASPAAQITAALNAVTSGDRETVVVPPSMRPGTAPAPNTASDYVINDRATVIDQRGSYGLLSNQQQRATFALTRLFDTNTETVAQASDNMSVFGVEAFLNAGSGSNGADAQPVHGENVALYAGMRRKAGSTRGGWAANFVVVNYEAPDEHISTRGLELNIANASGVDATTTTPHDGVVVFAGGTGHSRYGYVVGNNGTEEFLSGIYVSSAVVNSGIVVEPSIPIGIDLRSQLRLQSMGSGVIPFHLIPYDDTTATAMRGRTAADAATVWSVNNRGDSSWRDLTATRGDGTGQLTFGSGSGYLYANGSNIQFSQPLKAMGTTALIIGGTGSPEGVTTAGVGSIFLRSNGGAGTTFYVKESGAGNTGWVAK
jgi:hypothetical protein